ncbi:uncharacterized protein F5147DRAFT_718383 [Suillus discolor]|uniref:Uncharacterized protein n=1 Tax=Suillus discolor TaxID=1912936 RepID=A0A9P7EY35_9AGAM|nr:uncharacterized protein F5147DRAFT_718383 [Suillus discolor]KAG2095458.1 hypothetical protein F5147DRAFT_718383 [Suillus discolor]
MTSNCLSLAHVVTSFIVHLWLYPYLASCTGACAFFLRSIQLEKVTGLIWLPGPQACKSAFPNPFPCESGRQFYVGYCDAQQYIPISSVHRFTDAPLALAPRLTLA